MHNGFDTTLIVFAFVAVFVIWKLRSVLGMRIGVERKPPSAPAQNPSRESAGVQFPGADFQINSSQNRSIEAYAKSDSAKKGLTAICDADRNFDIRGFLDGAASAYRWIVEAFANGDKQKLQSLLSPSVYANFESEIARREQQGEQAHVKVASIESMDVADARLLGRIAQVTVHIEANINSWTTGQAGAVIAGDADLQVRTEEFWTFSRALDESDPNWRLIATEHSSQA